MFRHTCVSTLRELKQFILSNVGAKGDRKIGNLAYRYQVITAENKLEYRPSWISEDNHVWITLERYRQVGGSSGFHPFDPPIVPSPINVAAPHDVPCWITTLEMILTMRRSHRVIARRKRRMSRNTPSVGGSRLVLPAPLPIHNLDEVPSFFQQLDLDIKHAEDPSMECVVIEYKTDVGVEFMVGHKMQNQ
ncbi:hypothetical protein PIB30_020825 [Stylosanthes scabra]|uniref:Uncharacterized protein n=1 Tax=Stylosanthes scabra TaxID=79078 RepID=A0ABU6UBW7_9FABA|nr:hypothetical protein [Stylosanthes scabra]